MSSESRACPNCQHPMLYDHPEYDVGLDEGWRCSNQLCGYTIVGDGGLLPPWEEIQAAVESFSNTATLDRSAVKTPDPSELMVDWVQATAKSIIG